MLIHYQDDVDVTAIAIPELIKLLQGRVENFYKFVEKNGFFW